MQEILNGMLVYQASYTGLLVEIGLILLLIWGYKSFSKNGFFVIFELFFEKAYEFFEDILGKGEKRWIKLYIISMFFIIIISNILGVFLEFITPMLGDFKESHPLFISHPELLKDLLGEHILEHYIKIPTADINFNIAMAVVGVIIVILEQFKALGFWKAIYEYTPIFGKELIPYEKGKLPVILDNIVFGIVKTFDIIISMFLGVLEIVGHFAKIISLSFRLFGNMTSGGILLAMLIGAISGVTMSLFGINFPVLGPVILYLQEILVAFIQALVFPLLIAIFIKVAKVH